MEINGFIWTVKDGVYDKLYEVSDIVLKDHISLTQLLHCRAILNIIDWDMVEPNKIEEIINILGRGRKGVTYDS